MGEPAYAREEKELTKEKQQEKTMRGRRIKHAKGGRFQISDTDRDITALLVRHGSLGNGRRDVDRNSEYRMWFH